MQAPEYGGALKFRLVDSTRSVRHLLHCRKSRVGRFARVWSVLGVTGDFRLPRFSLSSGGVGAGFVGRARCLRGDADRRRKKSLLSTSSGLRRGVRGGGEPAHGFKKRIGIGNQRTVDVVGERSEKG